MATMMHLDSPSMLARPAAEKENGLQPHKQLAAKGGGGGGTGRATVLKGTGGAPSRPRMALRAVNGDNLSSPALAKATPAGSKGRAALSNLTNTSLASSIKGPLASGAKPAASHAKCTPVAQLKPAVKRARAAAPAVVADIEQPYPKRVAPVVDDVPRLPRHWNLALPRDLWGSTLPVPVDADLDLSVPLEVVPPLPDHCLSDLVDSGCAVDYDDDELFVSDLHRDLAEDAKCLAAELLSLAPDAISPVP